MREDRSLRRSALAPAQRWMKVPGGSWVCKPVQTRISKGFLFPALPGVAPYCARSGAEWCQEAAHFTLLVVMQATLKP
jgi:hypothetical protein